MKKAIGRPTKYIPAVIFPKIEEYLTTVGREQTSLPSVEGLAIYLGVHKDTIYEWAKRHAGFSDYLKRVADKQKKQLMDDGLYGGREVNAAMAIFLLKAIHRLNEGPQVAIQINIKPILGGKAAKNVIHANNSDQETS